MKKIRNIFVVIVLVVLSSLSVFAGDEDAGPKTSTGRSVMPEIIIESTK